MSLDNFQDLSVRGSSTRAGFQFEFYCAYCTQRWKTPFQPYRVGQFNGLLAQLAYFFDSARDASHHASRAGEWGGNRAHVQARADAQRAAQSHYTVCETCAKACCADCFDAAAQCCVPCLNASRSHAGGGGTGADHGGHAAHAADGAGRTASGPDCPNCATPNGGGRFCAECGFDMASTHKSCPGCGAMCERATRFCADCGHGF